MTAALAEAPAPPHADDTDQWSTCESLADAIEQALDEAGEDVKDVVRDEQREADLAELQTTLETWVDPLEEAARELLADYEQAMDVVGVKATRASVKMQQALYDLDRRRTRG